MKKTRTGKTKCIICNKSCEDRAERIVRFCSRKCYGKSIIGKVGHRLGKKASAETRKRLSISHKGYVTPQKTKEKLSRIAKEKGFGKWMKGRNLGSEAPWWKGDKVKYNGLHMWVKSKLGRPKKCEHCKKTTNNPYNIHWANKSGEYKRDLSDWIRLCALCHKKYDKLQGIKDKRKNYDKKIQS